MQLEEATATWPVVQIDFQFVSERLVRNACLRPSNPILCGVGIKEDSTLWFVRTEDAILLQFLSVHGVIHETLQEIRHDSRKLEYVNFWAERIGIVANLNKVL
ncbi:MAG TPA: hypothetical protein PLY87_23345 [Planctomycetaceae bacterium]|nr:hypothetical protein [Planctomycetaceae bacterium]